MGRPFSPGATPFAPMRGRKRSLWREGLLILHLLQTAISPRLSLEECLHNWAQISLALREPPRARALQAAQLSETFSHLF